MTKLESYIQFHYHNNTIVEIEMQVSLYATIIAVLCVLGNCSNIESNEDLVDNHLRQQGKDSNKVSQMLPKTPFRSLYHCHKQYR